MRIIKSMVCVATLMTALGHLSDVYAAEERSVANRSDAVSSAGMQKNQPSDLLKLFQEMMRDDPRIKSAQANRDSSQGREREALGQMLPQLSANSAYNRSHQESTSILGSDTTSFYNGKRHSLSLQQRIYEPAVWYNYRRFAALSAQQDATTQATIESATVDLADQYFSALAAEDELALIQAELRATRSNLARAKSMFERQMAMITDVLEISARVDALEASEIEALNKRNTSREVLAERVGRPVTEPLKGFAEKTSFQMPSQGEQHWVNLVNNSPLLTMRQQALEASRAALSQAKAGHLPSVSLSLSAQRSDIGYENSQSTLTDTYVASVGVQIPLYSGGSTSARVTSSYADLMAAEQDLEATRRQLVRETRSAFWGVDSGMKRILASQKALASARKSRAAAEQSYEHGVLNAVDVLNRVKEEYASWRDLRKAQYDFVTNLMVLRRWTGTLAEDDIRQANEWLVAPQLTQGPGSD